MQHLAKDLAKTPGAAQRAFKRYQEKNPGTRKTPKDFLDPEVAAELAKGDKGKGKAPAKSEKEKGSKAPATKGDALVNERQKLIEKSLPKDLQGYPSEVPATKLKPEHRELIEDYNLEVVGQYAPQAVAIAKLVKKGIETSADICKMSKSVCKGNMGLTRDKMPQIEGGMSVKQMLASKDKLDQAKGKAMVQAGASPDDDVPVLTKLLDGLKKRGIKSKHTEVPVGALKATQKEIKAAKTYSMAANYLQGKFPGITDSIVISSDGYLLDGHHRWAALLVAGPKRKMKVLQIDMKMKDLLDAAASFPGVYKADFAGDPMSEEHQKAYKKDNAKGFFGSDPGTSEGKAPAKGSAKPKPATKKAAEKEAHTQAVAIAKLASVHPAFRRALLDELRGIPKPRPQWTA